MSDPIIDRLKDAKEFFGFTINELSYIAGTLTYSYMSYLLSGNRKGRDIKTRQTLDALASFLLNKKKAGMQPLPEVTLSYKINPNDHYEVNTERRYMLYSLREEFKKTFEFKDETIKEE